MASRLSLPQLPGVSEPQPPVIAATDPHTPRSTVSPTPKIQTQLSLKSSPVRPEPTQPSTPPQQGASRRSGRVPFNWKVVAPGSIRASFCQPPPPPQDSPRSYTVGPRTNAAAADATAADAARAGLPPQAMHAGSKKSMGPGQAPVSAAAAAPEGRANGNRWSLLAHPESFKQGTTGFPQLPGEYLEGAKMLARGPSLQDNPQAPLNWFDGYALSRMQELWAEHLASSEALLQQSNAAMRRQHREMLKVAVTLQPGDLRGLNDRVGQFIQDITECEAAHARACQTAESRWADALHTIVMVAFVRGLEAALAEREAFHQDLLREWERGRQKDIEDVRALAALELRKALRQQEANLAKQWTLDEERRQGTVKAAREAAMAELQHTRVQLAAGKHEVTGLKRQVDMLEAQVRAMKAVQQANTRLHQELDALTEQLNTLRFLHAQCSSSRGSSSPQLPSSAGARPPSQPAWGSNPLQRLSSGLGNLQRSPSGLVTLQRSTSRSARPRSPLADPAAAVSAGVLWSPDGESYEEYLGTEPPGDESCAATKAPAKKRKKRGKAGGKSKASRKVAGAGSASGASTIGAAEPTGQGSKLRKLASEPPTPSLRTPRSARTRPASTGSPILKGPKALDPLPESASEAEEDDSAAEEDDSAAEEESIMGSRTQTMSSAAHSGAMSDAAPVSQEGPPMGSDTRDTSSAPPAPASRASREGRQASPLAAASAASAAAAGGSGQRQMDSEPASPRSKALAAQHAGVAASGPASQPPSPRQPPASASSGTERPLGAARLSASAGNAPEAPSPAGQAAAAAATEATVEHATSAPQAAATQAMAIPKASQGDLQAGILSEQQQQQPVSEQLQQGRQQASHDPDPAAMPPQDAMAESAESPRGQVNSNQQNPGMGRSPRGRPPLSPSPRGVPPPYAYQMEDVASSADQVPGSFRAAFTPEVPNHTAALQGVNPLGLPSQPNALAMEGANDEPNTDLPGTDAAANRLRIMEAMQEHRALLAKGNAGLELKGEHVGVGGAHPNSSAAVVEGGVRGRLRVGTPAGHPSAPQSSQVAQGRILSLLRPYRNAIEVLGTHLEVQDAPAPDRTAYSQFIRSLSPPRPRKVKSAQPPGAPDQPTTSLPSGEPPAGLPDTLEVQGGDDGGEAGTMRPPSSPEAISAESPEEGPPKSITAEGNEEPEGMALGASSTAEVPQALVPSGQKVQKQGGQQAFKEGAKQIPPSFPGHKLGGKQVAGSLQTTMGATEQLDGEPDVAADAAAAAAGVKQVQPMTAEAAAAAMFVGQRPKERGRPVVAARGHKQLWPPSVIGQQQRKILRLIHQGSARQQHERERTWHMSPSADYTPRPQHIPTLEELSVAVAAPAAPESAESQHTGPRSGQDATPVAYTLQPPSLATANMHRQLLAYMELLLRQHRAQQHMQGH